MLPGLMQDVPLTLNMIRERVAALYADKTVTTVRAGGTTQTSYGGMLGRAGQLAQALRQLGIGRGDRVASFARNSQQHLELYLAVPCMGAVLHTINVRLPPAVIGALVERAKDAIVVVDRSLWEVWCQVPQPRCLRQVLLIDDDADSAGTPSAGSMPVGALDYEALLACEAPEFAWPELDEAEAAGLCYTSGTTGRPKGVLYSHRSSLLHAFACLFADGIALRERDVCLPIVPQFHANAWGFPHAALLAGAALVFISRDVAPLSLARAIEQNGVTVATAVPTVWINLLRALQSGIVDPGALRSLTRIPVGGAAVPPMLIDGFARFGIEVIHCWGMTEISPLGLVNVRKSGLDPAEAAVAQRSQGLPLPGCRVRIMADNGRPAPHDGQAVGEMQVSSPWAARAYFESEPAAGPADDSAFVTDQAGRRWLRTGDIASIDRHGYVRIVDRAKDLIKSGGEWISSLDLEACLLEHPGILQAAVIGAADPVWQERPVAYLVAAADAGLTPAMVQAHLAQRFAKWQIPDRITFLPDLPKGATGKTDKQALRAWAEESKPSEESKPRGVGNS